MNHDFCFKFLFEFLLWLLLCLTVASKCKLINPFLSLDNFDEEISIIETERKYENYSISENVLLLPQLLSLTYSRHLTVWALSFSLTIPGTVLQIISVLLAFTPGTAFFRERALLGGFLPFHFPATHSCLLFSSIIISPLLVSDVCLQLNNKLKFDIVFTSESGP